MYIETNGICLTDINVHVKQNTEDNIQLSSDTQSTGYKYLIRHRC